MFILFFSAKYFKLDFEASATECHYAMYAVLVIYKSLEKENFK